MTDISGFLNTIPFNKFTVVIPNKSITGGIISNLSLTIPPVL